MALRAEGAAVALVARESARPHRDLTRLEAAARSPPTSPRRDGPAVASYLLALGGLDLLVVSTGGPPPGASRTSTRPPWRRRSTAPCWSTVRPRGPAGHPRGPRPGDSVNSLQLGPREPIPGLVTFAMLNLPRARRLKSLVMEQLLSTVSNARAWLARHRAHRRARRGTAVTDARRSQEVSQRTTIARVSPLGRYGDPAELARAPRAPSRRLRHRPRAEFSCRWTAGRSAGAAPPQRRPGVPAMPGCRER